MAGGKIPSCIALIRDCPENRDAAGRPTGKAVEKISYEREVPMVVAKA
jgi:hypothetical protein